MKLPLLDIYDCMIKTRELEERLIKMFKQDLGFFWIGGPGEEGFNVPLGMLVKKGQGLDYDYLHLHYRSCGILMAMGADPIDPIRQMRGTTTDTHSGGRNFSGHFAMPEWNIVPITSPIETQYVIGIGTGIAQKGPDVDGITIIAGGDAGTAEGDFASCMVWASRPGNELPILMIVTNNNWGISTHADTQHGEKNIADRGTAFGIKNRVIDGNDPVESYTALQEAMDYVRKERKPFLLEAKVSRLYGHSSASGANFEEGVDDPVALFEAKLINEGILTQAAADEIRQGYHAEFKALVEKIKNEPQPESASIYDYTYKDQTGKTW